MILLLGMFCTSVNVHRLPLLFKEWKQVKGFKWVSREHHETVFQISMTNIVETKNGSY